jgi:AcrR family transcriptional regulator
MNKSPVRGRRPGPSDTRDRILATATKAFLAQGYQAVTLRSVAAEAGVDAALPTYYFGSKAGLFAAAMALPVSPAEVFDKALAGDDDGLPERLLRGMLDAWDDPRSGPPLRRIAAAAAASSEPELTRLVREAVGSQLIARLAARLGGPDGTHRAAGFGAQMSGVIFSRYLLALEPIGSMTPDEVVRQVLPGLRATLRPPTDD